MSPTPMNFIRQKQPTNDESEERCHAMVLGNGVILSQNPALPRLPGQVGLQGNRPVDFEDIDRAGEEYEMPVNLFTEAHVDIPDFLSPSKHRSKRLKQWQTWTTVVLPLAVLPYLELLRQTRSLRDDAPINLEEIEQIELWASDCSSASIQLIRSGLFPCSPVYPTLAVDIRVLDFVRRLFLRIAPNYTAWCNAATDFLASQGYHLPGDDPLRRRFANALQWYMSLNDMATALWRSFRRRTLPPRCLSPKAHCLDESARGEGLDSEDEQRPRAARRQGVSMEEVVDEDVEERESRKRCRSDSDSAEEWDPSEDQPTLSQPMKVSLLLADACFTQKHSAQKGGQDPPRTHPNSYFIPEEEVNACFTAADEARIKGSTRFFDVTANMTLLCRHDRALFTVNMNTPGEGQHYVLALIAKLFENLPPDTIVRFLYDIGSIHDSYELRGVYLPRVWTSVALPDEFITRESVLDAGYQTGEGCERLWHALSHLIAYGRVAGVTDKGFVFSITFGCTISNSQFNFNSEEGMWKLGVWLRRKVLAYILRREWDAQIKAQTKPLPRQHKNRGKSAVEEALRLRKSRDVAADYVKDLRHRIIDRSSVPWETATAELELETAVQTLRKAEIRLKKKEEALGVTARQQLQHLIKSPFLTKKMNARSFEDTDTRAPEVPGEHIQQRIQFCAANELMIIEQRINEHTQDSVKRRDPGIAELTRKYNKLCDDMATLIRQKKAPRNAISPVRIEMEGLFNLDVDDDIWLDIGLGYDDDDDNGGGIGSAPPLWLSNDNVRAGIRAMLDRDRCLEERKRLLNERNAMQEWFSLGRSVQYQLNLRKERLCCLFVTWERSIVGVACGENLPEWGPSDSEIVNARGVHVLGGGIEVAEDGDYDIEFEHDADGLLIEHLDSLTISENYREMQSNIETVRSCLKYLPNKYQLGWAAAPSTNLGGQLPQVPTWMGSCPKYQLGWAAASNTNLDGQLPQIPTWMGSCPKYQLGWAAAHSNQ
ncbi:hypothetical protein BT96DRAFT_950393 [Gymnopus androsaceus JB14]|uniref:CxC1-like cysteine cluster associated with KDZ transposases domain-containing protein n=1 Tax=Gymnopus androsaceus JB14 TaxID=1447944 RepID=A0A6A4GGT8_9AGAR|nr:hypothetical protein BT96DRAFT_950393 [Gymnopus androsaceus JB14]